MINWLRSLGRGLFIRVLLAIDRSTGPQYVATRLRYGIFRLD
jgi:hypothetical protein